MIAESIYLEPAVIEYEVWLFIIRGRLSKGYTEFTMPAGLTGLELLPASASSVLIQIYSLFESLSSYFKIGLFTVE